MKLSTLTLSLFFAAGLHAQISEKKIYVIRADHYLPAEFSADGKSHIIGDGTDYGSYGPITIYNDDLEAIKSFNVENLHTLSIEDFNCGFDSYYSIAVSQTLFNNDDTYEYVQKIKKSDSYRSLGFNIVTETGKVLQSILFGEGMEAEEIDIVRVNNRYFIRCDVSSNSYSGYYFYPINRSSTSGIKPLGEPVKLKVNPTLVGRGEHITLELGGSGRGEKQVSVHDAAGRTVYSMTVPTGQSSTQINASELSQGLNVISVKSEKGRSKSCKVIVK